MEERAKYTERKSFRLSSRDAYLLKQSGYSPRQAIEYFNRMFYSTEMKGLKIDLIKLEEKLKEQELEMAKTKENIKMVKEAIENKEQTKFNKTHDELVLNKEPLTERQCLARFEKNYKTLKRANENINSLEDVPDELFTAIAIKGKLEVEDFKQLVFNNFK